jgi:uncharacterized protein (DUF2461 family)
MSAPVDVLAVMGELFELALIDVPSEPRNPDSSEYDEWERACLLAAKSREARAAVRELIEAADEASLGSHRKAGGGWWVVRNDHMTRLRAALAKVGAP